MSLLKFEVLPRPSTWIAYDLASQRYCFLQVEETECRIATQFESNCLKVDFQVLDRGHGIWLLVHQNSPFLKFLLEERIVHCSPSELPFLRLYAKRFFLLK